MSVDLDFYKQTWAMMDKSVQNYIFKAGEHSKKRKMEKKKKKSRSVSQLGFGPICSMGYHQSHSF